MSNATERRSLFPTQGYRDFALRIRTDKEGYVTEVVRPPATSGGNPEVLASESFAIKKSELEKVWETIVSINTGVALSPRGIEQERVPIPTWDEVIPVGKKLRRWLLSGTVWEKFVQSLEKANAERRRLRIRLCVEVPGLRLLPWEWLYIDEWSGDGKRPYGIDRPELLLNPPLSLVQQPSIQTELQRLAVAEQVRILPIYSDVVDAARGTNYIHNLLSDFKRVVDALKKTSQDGLTFVAEPLWNPTPQELKDAIKRGDCHVLIYGGHGYSEDFGRSGWILSDGRGGSGDLPAKELADVVKGTPIRLAYLGACSLADVMAPQLMDAGVVAALAMRFQVSSQASEVFCDFFFRALAHFQTLDEAVADAREALMRLPGEYAECFTPVLFSRSVDNLLFAKPEEIQRGNYLRFVIDRYKYMPSFEENKLLPMSDFYVAIKLGEEEREPIRKRPEPSEEGIPQPALQMDRTLKSVDVEEALRKQRIVVRGEPGSGKSALAEYLAVRLARAILEGSPIRLRPLVPILVRLNEWSERGVDFLTYLQDKKNGWLANTEFGDDFADTVRKWVDSGECYLLLDGLDEVTKDRDKFISGLQKFGSAIARNSHIVVTTRSVGYHNELTGGAGFQHYELLPFEQRQIRQFAQGYFADAPDKVERLQKALQSTPQMRPLAANPLLLKIMCWRMALGLPLPERRKMLYEWAVHELLKRRTPTYPSGDRIEVLRKVALHFFERNKQAFEEADLLMKTREILCERGFTDPRDGDRILDDITHNSGLLSPAGPGMYRFFIHLTFHEYFTADEIAQRDDWLEICNKHKWDERWEEVLRLVTAKLAQKKRAQK
jgi:hypothetical protein